MLKRLFIASLALLIAIVLFWCYQLFFGSDIESFYSKSIYSALQEVELQYRDKKIATPFILEANETRPYRVAGLATDADGYPYAWIALPFENNEDYGIYMVDDHAKLNVSCAQVQNLLAKEEVSRAVSSFLKHQCKGE